MNQIWAAGLINFLISIFIALGAIYVGSWLANRKKNKSQKKTLALQEAYLELLAPSEPKLVDEEISQDRSLWS